MNRFNLLRRLVGGISVIAAAAIVTFSGCTTVNDYLGSDLTLQNQAMKIGQMTISGLEDNCNYFESRLYKTDSINTANITEVFFGTMSDETYGARSAGFFTQYLAGYGLDDDLFGYMPIFDSAVLFLSISNYGGDTTVSQEFEVFEVIDDTFLYDSADSIFFPTFDIDPYIAENPIFTFTFPDADNELYISATSVTMKETDYTKEFIDRLMLEAETEYDEDIYDDDEEWLEYFKGLYVRPKASLKPVTEDSAQGAIYSTSLSSSGFGFYGRSREEDDYTLIKDTVGMTYVFYSSYADVGNQSINMIDYNYEGSEIVNVKTPEDSDDNIPTTSILRVSGFTGVVSEITLTKELFEKLDAILDAEEAETGDVYNSLFFSQAKLRIYTTPITSYDYTTIDPYVLTPIMDDMPSAVGLYSNYSYYYYEEDDVTYTTLEGVADYIYAYESSYTLDFGGSMNRSWGCYVLDIPGSIQVAWNSYLELKEEAEENGTEIDWDSIVDRKVYLGPTATNLYALDYASLQAGDIDLNLAPMYLELTYTMIR